MISAVMFSKASDEWRTPATDLFTLVESRLSPEERGEEEEERAVPPISGLRVTQREQHPEGEGQADRAEDLSVHEGNTRMPPLGPFMRLNPTLRRCRDGAANCALRGGDI